jgi:hypothetical protein
MTVVVVNGDGGVDGDDGDGRDDDEGGAGGDDGGGAFMPIPHDEPRMHTYTHTHPCMHMHTHAYMHMAAHTHTYIDTPVCTCTMHPSMHGCIHTCTQACIRTTRIHTIRSRMHGCITNDHHAPTCMRMRACIPVACHWSEHHQVSRRALWWALHLLCRMGPEHFFLTRRVTTEE